MGTDPSKTLARRTTLPSGGRLFFAKMPDGARMRLGQWEARGGRNRGSILLLQGRAEFIEKYYESINDFLDRGYSVLTFDWRGQGLSDRGDFGRDIDHLEDFSHRIDDLEFIRQRFLEGNLPGPHYAIGHSMGGHILLRHMLRHRAAFERYIALSPMLGIAPGPIPEVILRWITKIMVRWGFSEKYMLTQKAMRDVAERESTGRRLTNDPVRLRESFQALRANPNLHLGGVSFGWMRAVFRSCDLLLREARENTRTYPLLVLISEDELLVHNERTLEFVEELPAKSWDVIENAKHELLKETDEIRLAVFGKMMRFLRAV